MRKSMSNLIIITSSVLLLACGAFAGNLEPSTPPIEGTMHTLDEIYELIASGGCVPQYQYWHEPLLGWTNTIHAGSGIVHSILLSLGEPSGDFGDVAQIELKDGDNVIGIFNLDAREGGEPSRMFTLDIPYKSNLSIRFNHYVYADIYATVIYLPKN